MYNYKGREFTLACESGKITNRLRAQLQADGLLAADAQTDETKLNKLMRVLLKGDHTDINWFDVECEITDKVVTDFFTPSETKTENV